MAVLVLALCIKATVPAGFMLTSQDGVVLTVTLCSDGTGERQQVKIVVPGRTDQRGDHSDPDGKNGQCAFSALSHAAIGGTDPILLAVALVFILLLGLAPAPGRPRRPIAYLRPPLRGPPAP